MRKIDIRNFRRATRATPREINRQIALNLVREHQPISRADVARQMEIGRGVVTSLINELIDEGVIYEGAPTHAPRGRRPKMLYIRTRDRFIVAVDVRFSRTYLMLSDFGGAQIALETFETIPEPDKLVAELTRRIKRLLESHEAVGHCEGIGLVVPGMVDHHSGKVMNSPQLGWHDVDARLLLEEATGLPVAIENAPLACALSQMWMGKRGESTRNFVYVTVSDGVGAGIVVNGQPVRGESHNAGEFGHIPLDPTGPRCLCGSRGCWEAYTSNLATISRYLGRELSWTGTRELLHEVPLTIDDLVARARSGDVRASKAIEETGRYLGVGLAGIINALNPSRIYVGGEITAAWDRIEGVVRKAIRERAVTAAAAATPITPEQVGGYPRLRGATALVAAPLFAAPELA